jgi:hypothetical protein
MAVANVYGKAFVNLLGGEVSGDTFAVDYLSDTIKMSLHTSSYTPNLDTHETVSDLTNEVTGTGYTTLGVALASKTNAYTPADSWGTARANSTVYALGAIVRPSTGNGHLYRAIVAGTSAGSAPSFPTISGQTVADNTVTWAEVGRGITVIDAADPAWGPGATISGIRYAVVFKDTGTAGTSPLLALLDFSSDQAVTNGTFSAQLDTLGIIHFTQP